MRVVFFLRKNYFIFELTPQIIFINVTIAFIKSENCPENGKSSNKWEIQKDVCLLEKTQDHRDYNN